MKVAFLKGSEPIVKRYELDPATKALIKHPYPFIYEFTSEEVEITDLTALYRNIEVHAAAGNCLLKGELEHPLISQSRAGSTNAATRTQWACLDIDGIEGYADIDTLLSDIGVNDVSYVLQWSSSMGIENSTGLRAHIFLLLSSSSHPQILKQWLQSSNLNCTKLNAQLELTKTGNALRWPLDITTCQNDKLLYIAPPLLQSGIQDPFSNSSHPRITLITKKLQHFTLPSVPSKESLKQLTDNKINELRLAANLPKRKATKFKYQGDTEYMTNPDAAMVTDIKHERGFTYLNINGGDSWGYYHPDNNPGFIFNFKGEPVYKTEDLLPEYWASIVQKSENYKPDHSGTIWFAFRDFRSSNYFNGNYNTSTKALLLAQAKSETQLRHFMKQHGQPLGDFIPDWNLSFDPHTDVVIDPDAKTLNIFQLSPIMKKKPTALHQPPVLVDRLVKHVLGNDDTAVEHFYNWMACIVQYLDRTGTAWVMHGTQGTGKGLLFHQLISPILGDQNTTTKRMEELDTEFTGFMENKFLCFVDEIQAGRSLYHEKITAKLKNLIVEPTISIRKMYHAHYEARNYANFIFASNKDAPVEISPDDRRFNVGAFQRFPLLSMMTSSEIDQIRLDKQGFYDYLMSRPADRELARTPLTNQARKTMIDTSRNAIDVVGDALRDGNLAFFWDHLLGNQALVDQKLQLVYGAYRTLIKDLVEALLVQDTEANKLTREELYTIYQWCIGNVPQSPHKFSALLKHHGIKLESVWKKNRSTRGIPVKWATTPEALAQYKQEITGGLV